MRKLIEAVKKENLKEVKILLAQEYKNSPLIDQEVDDEGNNAVFIAAGYNSPDILMWLLQEEAKVDQPNKKGWTPLHNATFKGRKEAMVLLIQAKANVNHADVEGWSPLLKAASNGHKDAVLLLIQAKANVNQANKGNASPLYMAAYYGHKDVVAILIEAKANVNQVDKGGCSPLFAAAQKNHKAVAELLIHQKANVNLATVEGTSPLLAATEAGHKDVVVLLIHANANINQVDEKGWSPLLVATYRGHINVVEVLLKAGAMVNQPAKDGCTPLLVAVQKNRKEVIEELIQLKANVNQSSEMGATPLHYAAEKGYKDVVEVLLRVGANVNQPTNNGFVPLHGAAAGGHIDVIKMLIHAQANVDQTSEKGHTPLHVAALKGHKNVVEILLRKGAKADQPDSDGLTPLMIANLHNHQDVKDLLEKAIAERGLVDNENVISQHIQVKKKKVKKVTQKNIDTQPDPQNASNLKQPEVISPNQSKERLTPRRLDEAGVMHISFKIPYNELTLGNQIGKGSFGIVYQGTWNYSDVAIKMLLLPEIEGEALEEFKQEASIMAELRSQFIVQFFGVCLEPNHLAFVMEYIPKGSLYSFLHSNAELDWSRRTQLGLDTVSGLAYLHSKNILHRDLKSLNILVTDNYRGKITDFGLSKIKNETMSQSKDHSSTGSLLWMAPELFTEEKPQTTQKTDVYSCGLTLWEIASRKTPFAKAHNPHIATMWVVQGKREEIPSDTPEQFAKAIRRCWDQAKEKRPSAAEVIQILREGMHSSRGSAVQSPRDSAGSCTTSYRGNLNTENTQDSYKGNLNSLKR